jgi:aminoglycoside 6-adenylyltransferase
VTAAAALLEAVRAWARERPDIRAACLLGSHARTESPADEWSDVDVILFADEPALLVDDPSWLARFGRPLITFVEPTAIGGERERRVLYEDGTDVDFAVFPAAAAAALAGAPEPASAIARGYRIIHDELGLEAVFAARTTEAPAAREPHEIVQDFWYHAVWAAKKLRRGEGVTARFTVESYLKRLLLELARLHSRRRDASADTWHGTRFAERWLAPRALAAIWEPAASPDELPRVLRAVCEAFDALATELGALDEGTAAARDGLGELLRA